MFERLKENLIQEKKIISEMRKLHEDFSSTPTDKKAYISGLTSLSEQLIILNNSIPKLLDEWDSIKKVKKELPKNSKKDSHVRVSYLSKDKSKNYITINKKDRENFLKKLKLSEESLDKIKSTQKKEEKSLEIKPSKFISLSNRLFGKFSEKLVPYASDISKDLKKANLRYLISTYISMAILGVLLSFLFGLLIFIFLLILDFSNLFYFWVPFALAIFTGFMFYVYPASEASSVQKKISQELPFATIHMAAIAGSNIEPVKIFRIIAISKEYPNVGYEIKKVLAQVDIYGYDLVASLKNVSERISNKKLADLFSGLATNISTGGELKNYLEKKADNFLLDYKLEREKFSDLAGTFMDVYISILIAAPLILMMMFIVMNVAGLGLAGVTISFLLIISVGGVVLLNIVFLVVLNFKQPSV